MPIRTWPARVPRTTINASYTRTATTRMSATPVIVRVGRRGRNRAGGDMVYFLPHPDSRAACRRLHEPEGTSLTIAADRMGLMPFVSVPEALEEIRAGRVLVVVDDEDRENE